MSRTALFILGIILALGGIAVRDRVGGGDGIEWIFYIASLFCWYKALTKKDGEWLNSVLTEISRK
jgi:dolichyl-phosphate-mannose--protein O-mannosyl transferase